MLTENQADEVLSFGWRQFTENTKITDHWLAQKALNKLFLDLYMWGHTMGGNEQIGTNVLNNIKEDEETTSG